MHNGTTHQENNLAVSYKTKHARILWPSCFTTGHLSQRNKNPRSHKICMPTFTAASFTTTKNRNNPKALRVMSEELWYIHTVEHCETTKKNRLLIYKRNELLLHGPWINLKGMMQSEKIIIPENQILCGSIYVTFLR